MRTEELLRGEMSRATAQLAEISRVRSEVLENSHKPQGHVTLDALDAAAARLRILMEGFSERLWVIAAVRWLNRVEASVGRAKQAGTQRDAIYRYLVARRDQASAILKVWAQEPRTAAADEDEAQVALNRAAQALDVIIGDCLTARAADAIENARSIRGTEEIELEVRSSPLTVLNQSHDALDHLLDQALLIQADAEVERLLG